MGKNWKEVWHPGWEIRHQEEISSLSSKSQEYRLYYVFTPTY